MRYFSLFLVLLLPGAAKAQGCNGGYNYGGYQGYGAGYSYPSAGPSFRLNVREREPLLPWRRAPSVSFSYSAPPGFPRFERFPPTFDPRFAYPSDFGGYDSPYSFPSQFGGYPGAYAPQGFGFGGRSPY